MPGAGQPDAGQPDAGQPDSGQPGASATQLELEPRAANSYIARVLDTGLFYETTFVLEVESSRPAALIEQQFPLLCKIGPVTRMADIVASNLPGFVLTHVPTPPPPRQLRAIPRSVYFVVEKDQPAWADRGERPAIGVHFAGDWPDLRLTLWATMETET
jgi:type VI secretion system protein ImpJ